MSQLRLTLVAKKATHVSNLVDHALNPLLITPHFHSSSVSFVYPKNSYKLNLNVETKKLNNHEFNIGQLFSHVARSIGKNLSFLNPFKLSSGFGGLKTTTTSTTTEANFDFSAEVTEDSAPSINSGKEDSKEETEAVTENFDIRIADDSTTKKTQGQGARGGFGYIPPSMPSNQYVPPLNSGYLPSNLRKRQQH